jgi:hypothetical protein
MGTFTIKNSSDRMATMMAVVKAMKNGEFDAAIDPARGLIWRVMSS